MRRLFAIFTAATAVLVSAATARASMEIVHPPDGALLRDQTVAVIIHSTEAVEPKVSFGDDRLAITAFKDPAAQGVYFHAVTYVATAGRHKLVVERGDLTETRWVFTADPLTAKIPGQFEEYEFHLRQRELSAGDAASCASAKCHAYDLVEDEPVEEGRGCRVCHPRSGEYRHAPARLGECYLCHSTDNYRPTLAASTSCLLCHSDKKESFKEASHVHGPANYQQCALCHNPHGERETMMTWRGQNGTCVTCHENYDKIPHVVGGIGSRSAGHPIKGVENPLSPTDEFSCGGCHDPHTAEHPMMFQYGATNRLELCKKCHEGKY